MNMQMAGLQPLLALAHSYLCCKSEVAHSPAICCADNLRPDRYDDFIFYLTEVCKWYKDTHGLVFRYPPPPSSDLCNPPAHLRDLVTWRVAAKQAHLHMAVMFSIGLSLCG